MTRTDYKIPEWDWKKKVEKKPKKSRKLLIQDETKEPTEYGKYTRRHPNAPTFRHEQASNNIKPYRRVA
jgi:hypothetical protein